MGKKQKIIDFVNDIEGYLGTVVFIVLTVLLTIQVVTRYVFGRAFTWGEEVGVIMFVWLIYLGASNATKTRQHLRIDMLLDALSFKSRRAMLLSVNVVCIGFCLYTIPPIMQVISDMRGTGATMALSGIPKYITYMIVPVCLGTMCIRFIQDCVRLCREKEGELGVKKKMISLGDEEAEENGGEK